MSITLLKNTRHILLAYSKEIEPAILLPDINIPLMNGWEFFYAFENYPKSVKKQLTVYIVSSTVDHHDKEKAPVC